MTVLTVIEHQWRPIGGSRPGSLSEPQAEALEQLQPSLPAGAIEWRRREVKFAQYCGVVQLGALTLEVLPKLSRDHEDVVRSRNMLVRMLQAAGLFRAHAVGSASLGLQNAHLLDWFIDHFRGQVQAQLRQGMIRRYVEHHESLAYVRGRIDMPRQLRDNLLRPHVIACRYEELEHDNQYNQSLVAVLRMLRAHTHHPRLRHDLEEVISHFGMVSEVQPTAEQIERLPFRRMEERWQPIFSQAALFLRCLYPDVLSGDLPALALLFDMNVLFEKYVAAQLRRSMKGYQITTQRPIRHLAVDSRDRPVFALKPDIVVLNAGNPVFVADTKWKLLDMERRQSGVSRADMHQMAAYAARYNCDEVALIYPIVSGAGGLQTLNQFRLQPTGVRITVIGVDLKREDRLMLSLDGEHRGPERAWQSNTEVQHLFKQDAPSGALNDLTD
ncbi:McrC family protein [Alcanivorax sp. 1008]|uniref:McrC family protein n=1 Tax=Alcanivorax sp. 1008 TaxID=2816853 RepID=UPI001D9648D3|nr:McrC family protein [Alcanivorax sp. 1008]MCC1498117.1 hypothetical protein [Alcanivorax sp. 1008]